MKDPGLQKLSFIEQGHPLQVIFFRVHDKPLPPQFAQRNKMKLFLLFPALLSSLFFYQDGALADEGVRGGSQIFPTGLTPPHQPTKPGNEIIGTWKLSLDAFDRNENQLLEEEERKKRVPNHYILKFNAAGSCRIQNLFNGTYKIKDEGGKKNTDAAAEKGRWRRNGGSYS